LGRAPLACGKLVELKTTFKIPLSKDRSVGLRQAPARASNV
jgi:hypothetical protein